MTLHENQYISAGWIDEHVHCYEKMSLYYDFPDKVGVEKGVTSVIDAGSTGAENIPSFYAQIEKCKTNVFALVNISKFGIIAQDELADLSKIQKELVAKRLLEYPDFILGIKARMSKTVVGENGVTPLELAKEIQHEHTGLPLMVHIGSAPPELEDILNLLDKGDVLTHCFNGKENGIVDRKLDKVKSFVQQAKDKGIIFDIGHGTDSFNFHVATLAMREGIKADAVSTDIYIRNRENGPVYDLATTLEKLHVVGYTWPELIDKITVAPAANFRLVKKGKIEKGFDADFTVFTLGADEKVLTDSNGCQKVTYETIQPVKTIIGGIVYDN